MPRGRRRRRKGGPPGSGGARVTTVQRRIGQAGDRPEIECGLHESRKPERRVLEPSVGIDQRRPDDSGAFVGFERGHHRRQRARGERGVRVEQQDERGSIGVTGRPRGERDVVRRREAAVAPFGDEPHPRMMLRHERDRLVHRAVVDDDDVRCVPPSDLVQCGANGRQAGIQEGRGVEADDHDTQARRLCRWAHGRIHFVEIIRRRRCSRGVSYSTWMDWTP